MPKKTSKIPDRLSILNELEFLNTRKTIDPAIKQLISDLNNAGFETQSSCQGKRSRDDVKNHRHCNHAFITFNPFVPPKIKRKAKSVRLFVFNGDMSLTSLDGSETTWDDIFLKNRTFEYRVRQLFRI